jgi:hypothetical protein
MRVVTIGAMIVLLASALTTAGARAEDNPLQKMEQQQREDAKEIDKAYEKTLKSTRTDGPVKKVDPWGTVRSADPAPKPK